MLINQISGYRHKCFKMFNYHNILGSRIRSYGLVTYIKDLREPTLVELLTDMELQKQEFMLKYLVCTVFISYK